MQTAPSCVLLETTAERGDPHYQFEAEIRFDADGSILTED